MSCFAKKTLPAVLLAAGKGTRLAPLTDAIPKCLVPIGGRPLLDFWLERCVRGGMQPVIVNTHHLAGAVEQYILASPWRDVITLAHEATLLGTGGTVLAHAAQLSAGSFFVAHADNLSFFDMNDFLQAHQCRPAGCVMTMMLFHSPTPHSCGIVRCDARGVVQEFFEKVANPPGNLANGAVYIMEPEVLSMLHQCGSCTDISIDLIPRCLGRIATWVNTDYHRDIGTPQSYETAQNDMCMRLLY